MPWVVATKNVQKPFKNSRYWDSMPWDVATESVQKPKENERFYNV